MPKHVNRVLPNTNSKLVSVVRQTNQLGLTDEEDKIRNEAIVQSRPKTAKAKIKNSILLKQPVKKIDKENGSKINGQH